MDSIAQTAIGVAAVRAEESRRPDRLFDDPLAAAFVAASGTTGLSPEAEAQDARWRATLRGIVVRTRYFDELLIDASATCRQIVLLGAGLDARAFRLTWPRNTTVYEIDQPDLLSWKQEVLAGIGAEPLCERVPIAADLREDWAPTLAAAGHRADRPTAWLAEGLLTYLSAETVEALLETVRAGSASRSRLGLTLRTASKRPPLDPRWISHAPEDPVVWLAGHGWQATLHDRAERAAAYGRPDWLVPGRRSLVDAVWTDDR